MDSLLPDIRVPVGGTIDLEALFGRSAPVWLEVGFGGGEHLSWQADENRDVNFIGCEPFLNGIAKLLADIDEKDLAHVRIHDDDARDVLETLPDASIDRAFLLFPDPWHKTRHHKRRFVNPENLDHLARVMTDGAEFRVASDIPHYCRWTLREIRKHGVFEWQAACADDWRIRPDDWPGTRYEAKAIREGRTPAYLSFRRRAR